MSECKFSTRHYLETISSFLDNGYHIGPVGDYFHDKVYDKQILLRHDVDLSLHYALDMALVEKDQGIRATYYILLHSSLYSPLSPEGRETVRKIKEAGHEIGLHIDSRYYLGPAEFSILEHIAQCNITTWCQHLITITPPLDMPGDAAKIPYKYMSDSGMHWREGCWHNHVNKQYDKLHILIHPEWTMASPSGLRTKWEILEDLKDEARDNLAASFRDFRELVQQYMQVVTA